jgi:hypothetical protein
MSACVNGQMKQPSAVCSWLLGAVLDVYACAPACPGAARIRRAHGVGVSISAAPNATRNS